MKVRCWGARGSPTPGSGTFEEGLHESTSPHMTAADADARAAAYGLELVRERIVIDIDATIVTCRLDKQDAAGTFKRSHGFHPLLAVDVGRREVPAQLDVAANLRVSTFTDGSTQNVSPCSSLPRGDGVAMVRYHTRPAASASGVTWSIQSERRTRRVRATMANHAPRAVNSHRGPAVW